MEACKQWKRYKGVHPPRCDGGRGCDRCRAIYQNERNREAYQAHQARDPFTAAALNESLQLQRATLAVLTRIEQLLRGPPHTVEEWRRRQAADAAERWPWSPGFEKNRT